MACTVAVAQPRPGLPPAASGIQPVLAGAYFHDSWVVVGADPQRSALEQLLATFAATPVWVDRCMAWRNRVVSCFGLRDLGAMRAIDPQRPADDYRPGERLGIFTLYAISADEVLFGDRDKHLDVTLSLHRGSTGDGRTLITVTTVVHVHNWLGRLYMLPVTPMHKLIAPATLRKVLMA